MKRRNMDLVKAKRLLKKSKNNESFLGSSFIYLKYILVWMVVIGADYLLEFRFEYLWPLWVVLRKVYDSLQYQGLAFAVLFMVTTFALDTVCFLALPVNWLFFIASTYVWIHFMCHTDKGLCMRTGFLWALFMYIEGFARAKDHKSMPFEMLFCRPFAAHCVGFPIVNFGFGLKSFIGYQLRQRKVGYVSKENEEYFKILKEALPKDTNKYFAGSIQEKNPAPDCLQPSLAESVIGNGLRKYRNSKATFDVKPDDGSDKWEPSSPPANSTARNRTTIAVVPSELEYMEEMLLLSSKSMNEFERGNIDTEKDKNSKNIAQVAKTPRNDMVCEKNANVHQANGYETFLQSKPNNLKATAAPPKDRKIKNKDFVAENLNTTKADPLIAIRLESDVKRLKGDLQASRQNEQELHNQISTLLGHSGLAHTKLKQCQQDNDNLQNRLHGLVTARQNDRCTINNLEKRITDERKSRQTAEDLVDQLETRLKILEDQSEIREKAIVNLRGECNDSCRNRRNELELELRRIKRDHRAHENILRGLERENLALKEFKDQSETEVLMSALSAMQEKTTHLENSLSAETKIKLELFSALGEAKRQIEIVQGIVADKQKEIDELKMKITEVLAVCPQSTMPSSSLDVQRFHLAPRLLPQGALPNIWESSRQIGSPRHVPCHCLETVVDCGTNMPYPVDHQLMPGQGMKENCYFGPVSNRSNLDPNARIYTPKSIDE